MYKCPVDYYKDNMIFSENGCWAAFEIEGLDYENRSQEAKLAIFNNVVRFIANIPYEAKILVIPVGQEIRRNYESLRKNLWKEDPLYETALKHSEMTEEYLLNNIEENGNANDYRIFIITNLTTQEEEDVIKKVTDAVEYIFKDPYNAINSLLGVDSRIILKSRIDHFRKLCDNFFIEQKNRLSLAYLEEIETQWLIKRVMYRGINKALRVNKSFKPQIEKISKKAYKTSKSCEVLFDGKIKPQKSRYIEIEHDDGSISYQSFLSVTSIPDELDFPGSEYIFMLQDFNIPTEVCIHIDRLTDYQSKATLTHKKSEIDSQIGNVDEAGEEIPEELLEAKEELLDFDMDIRNNKLPICKTSITFCLAADSKEKLEERVNLIKGTYEDAEFGIVRSLTDQYKLFMEFIPGTKRYLKDFVMPLNCKMIAGSMFPANRKLGDKENAPYIGTTGEMKKNVFLNMARACLENKSASATFFGNLGYGKSFNANLLTVLHVMYGAYGLIFDPKGERDHWTHAFPWLEGHISNIKLSSDNKYKGMLDPFNIYKDDVEAACELANNVVTEIYKLNPKDDQYIALGESLEKIKKEPIRSMSKLVDLLNAFDPEDELFAAARSLARRLKLLQTVGMSKLLFGNGEEKALNLNNRLNILQIENLKLPSIETPKEDYTQEETISAVLITVIGSFAKKFALTPRDVFSIVLFDESWFLKVTSEGRKLYDFLARMGRSLFTGCIFNGHSVTDLASESIKNAISYKFCFHTDNTDEAKRMLEYMNMDVTEDNIKLIQNLENRQCLFQDLDKHVDVLTFDAVFDDLIEVFSTTPKTKAETA
ncbi:ATP-binding protein [Clostridium saccharoperbutylacetonicum]|uniref:ATP-binding protein n=1 Tax=Clostridium saccharoperbutylacetonicum TaxID=36745 RepID=UPI0039E8D9DB